VNGTARMTANPPNSKPTTATYRSACQACERGCQLSSARDSVNRRDSGAVGNLALGPFEVPTGGVPADVGGSKHQGSHREMRSISRDERYTRRRRAFAWLSRSHRRCARPAMDTGGLPKPAIPYHHPFCALPS
jgi:hypothetical protein